MSDWPWPSLLLQRRRRRATARPIHNISVPVTEPGALTQDQAYFLLREGGEMLRLRFHDYGNIYKRPGLDEQLFYERLRCNSPDKARSGAVAAMRRRSCEKMA